MLLACNLALPVSIADALVGAEIIDERIPAVDCAVVKYQYPTDFVTRATPGHCGERIEAALYRHGELSTRRVSQGLYVQRNFPG